MVQLNDGIVLGELIDRDNCKVLALLDKNLSSAILDLDGVFSQRE